MPETARKFGLTVNADVDERFDVRKSTKAATAYLAYLYRFFGDWPLAIAAYNCGEGAMRKAMDRANRATLDELTAYCRRSDPDYQILKEETLRFVPQFAAAVMVMTKADNLGLSAPTHVGTSSRSEAKQESRQTALSLSGTYHETNPATPPPPRSLRIQ